MDLPPGIRTRTMNEYAFSLPLASLVAEVAVVLLVRPVELQDR